MLHEPSREHFGQLHGQLMPFQVLAAKDSVASFTFTHTSLKQRQPVALSQAQGLPYSGLRHLQVEMQVQSAEALSHAVTSTPMLLITRMIRTTIYCTPHSPRHYTECFVYLVIFDLHKTHFTGKGTKIQKDGEVAQGHSACQCQMGAI